MVTYALLGREFELPLAYRLGVVALIGHVLVGAFLIPNLPYHWDIEYFHRTAVALLSAETTTASPPVRAFASFQAILYATFGRTSAVVSVINGTLAVITAFLTGVIARSLYPSLRRDGTTAVVVCSMFMPLPFVFLTIPMRDTLTVFLLFALLALSVSVFEGTQWNVVVIPPLWGLLYLLRPELGLVFLLGLGCAGGVAVYNTVARRPVTLSSAVGTIALGAIVGFALFTERFPIDGLQGKLEFRATGGAAYLDGITYESWTDVFVLAPARAVYFQFTPFPLHVNSLFDVVAALELPLLIVLVVAGLRSLTARKTADVPLVLLGTVYLAGVVGYGLIDSNFGTTVRHRIPFVYLLVIFAGPVLERWLTSLGFGAGIGDSPGHSCENDSEKRKTEELDGHV